MFVVSPIKRFPMVCSYRRIGSEDGKRKKELPGNLFSHSESTVPMSL